MSSHLPSSNGAPIENDEFQDQIFTPNASERTIDQLLEEEFLINNDFFRLFTSNCFDGALDISAIARNSYRSARQVKSGHDESDLIILIEQAGKTYALMIENKINASKQKRQPERYIQRGESGQRGQLWDKFETCLIAPQSYLNTRKDKDYYHNYISYENIISFLSQTVSNEARLLFRLEKFGAAIKKKQEHIPAPDIPEAVKFVSDMKKLAAKRVPNLNFESGRANTRVLWFHFSRNNYPSCVGIIIKMEAVVTEFKLPKCHSLVEDRQETFEEHGFDFLMAKSGSSCTIRKSVEPINCLHSFESQKVNINRAIDYVIEMDEFLKRVVF